MRPAVLLVVAGGALTPVGCSTPPEKQPTPAPIATEAGFVTVAPRDVTLHGVPIHIDATAHLFYNFEPADSAPEAKPVFVLFNGFADEIVRSFGTGRRTVADGGDVVDNPSSLTSVANLLYIEPRQAGFSYDVVSGRPPNASDCSRYVFNEYVDAADVLFGVLAFLEAHPRLTGPVVWVGESYAGVRVSWILAYLRGRSALAPYADATLESKLANLRAKGATTRLAFRQILLEPWLMGKAEGDAIQSVCAAPLTVSAVEQTIGMSCPVADACACATDLDRSLYNFDFTNETQLRRVYEADGAHVTVSRLEALLGVPIASIAGLAAKDRADGFKCIGPDDTVPPEDEIVAALGALPNGQSYFVPFSPLQPGKEVDLAPADWSTENFVGPAFVDNLHDVPAFITRGPFDLVVPTSALAPALGAVIGAGNVDASDPNRIRVHLSDGDRFIDVGTYPTAGHMITMLEGPKLATDVAGLARAVDARLQSRH